MLTASSPARKLAWQSEVGIMKALQSNGKEEIRYFGNIYFIYVPVLIRTGVTTEICCNFKVSYMK